MSFERTALVQHAVRMDGRKMDEERALSFDRVGRAGVFTGSGVFFAISICEGGEPEGRIRIFSQDHVLLRKLMRRVIPADCCATFRIVSFQGVSTANIINGMVKLMRINGIKMFGAVRAINFTIANGEFVVDPRKEECGPEITVVAGRKRVWMVKSIGEVDLSIVARSVSVALGRLGGVAADVPLRIINQ